MFATVGVVFGAFSITLEAAASPTFTPMARLSEIFAWSLTTGMGDYSLETALENLADLMAGNSESCP
jgi:hypothetical protein